MYVSCRQAGYLESVAVMAISESLFDGKCRVRGGGGEGQREYQIGDTAYL